MTSVERLTNALHAWFISGPMKRSFDQMFITVDDEMLREAGVQKTLRSSGKPISLMDHQREFLKYLFCENEGRRRAVVLAHDMGLGKTATVLVSAALASTVFNNTNIVNQTSIIVCPTFALMNAPLMLLPVTHPFTKNIPLFQI